MSSESKKQPLEEAGHERPAPWYEQLFGPPLLALRRLWLAVVARLAKASIFWQFLFMGATPDEQGELTPPTRSAWLLTSAIVGVTFYGWPLRDILPPVLFIGVVVIATFLIVRAIQYASLRGSGHVFEHWLRESERNTGLVWWGRLGALLAAGGCVLAFVLGQPTMLPLTISVFIGFVALLGQGPQFRELRTIRAVPPMPPDEPDPEGEDGNGEPDPDFVVRLYKWTLRTLFGANAHQLRLFIHEPTYEQFKRTNPGKRWEEGVPRFDSYIVEGTTPDVERAAAKLLKLSKESHYSTFEEVSLVLAFVQTIEYSFDIDSRGQEDYWRYPLETLYDETGDCEDSSILAAALLRRLGHHVVTMMPPEHVAIGVEVPPGSPGQFVEFEGRRMYYCETTGKGWSVGEVPGKYLDVDMPIYAVPPLDVATT